MDARQRLGRAGAVSKTLFLAAGALAALAALVASAPAGEAEPAEFEKVPKTHPRLLVGQEAAPHRLSLEELRKLVPADAADFGIPHEGRKPDATVHALRYLLSGKDEDAAAAVKILKVRGSMHYQAIDLWAGNYALAYDWVHDWKGLSDEDRKAIEENLLAAGRGCVGLTSREGRQVFHNSYGQMLGTMGLAGLALFDRPEGRELLALAVRQYEKEWMAAWDHKGGAVHEGASYAPEFYKPTYQFLAACSSATGRDLFAENEQQGGRGLSEFLHWMDWVERPDGTYSREGDIVIGWRAQSTVERAYAYDLGNVFLPLPRREGWPVRWAAGDRIVKLRGAGAYRSDNVAWAAVFQALLKRREAAEQAMPKVPSEPLPPPLARLFGRDAMGFVVMRSGADQNAAHLTFHCGDHFGNHQHFDQNHFAIFAGGRELALDNGYYSAYGKPHFLNYWKSSWAHNTVCVRRQDAGEAYEGGQRHLEMKECASVEDYRKNRTRFETGTFLGFKTEGNWAWAAGDASKAYPEDVLKQFVRQIAYLKDESALVVYDEVEPAREADRPVFLLQCVREPGIEGANVLVANGEMVLIAQPLLPAAEDAKVEKVYGPDVHGKLIWEGARKETVERTGAWRVEISRKTGGKARFLAVLSWRPVSVAAARPALPEVGLAGAEGRVGARVGAVEVVFDPDPSKPPAVGPAAGAAR